MRRRGTTSSPVSPRAWARPCPCCSPASSFHWVIFFGHELVYLLEHVLSRFNDDDYRATHYHQAATGGQLPQAWLFSSCWRPGIVNLTWKCALCSFCSSPSLLPTTMSASFCFSATARRLQEGAVEASLGAHCRPRVLSVN